MSTLAFVDLASSKDAALNMRSDVCVVGAGAAGIYLAVQLAAKGLDVILVEAGNVNCSSAASVGFDAQFEKELYPGATIGRFFGMGGSTSRWGGLLIPHTQHDLRALPERASDPWAHIVQSVAANSERVLTRLGWHRDAGFSEFAHDSLKGVGERLRTAGFDVMASLFLPFRRKNLVHLLEQRPVERFRIKVIYNAVAKSWMVGSDSTSEAQIKQLRSVSSNGNQLEISADRFVVAAGAIESARLLLEMNDAAPKSIIRVGASVGCFLSDHLSLSIADVAPSSMRELTSLFSPRFSGGWMRSFRFLEASPPPDAPRAFLHFIFNNENPGFVLAREILGAMQGRRWPRVSPLTMANGIEGLISLGYKRQFESVLHIPLDTPTHLQLDMEQFPAAQNRVSLGNEHDRYGRRVAKISWSISERDIECIRSTAQRVLGKWPGKKAGLPELLPRIDTPEQTKPHDAYHPVATCRMGDDMEAVVDRDLKVWGMANLWVVSTGVLPSAGTANPTFTMLCLAEGLVDRLSANRKPAVSV